MADEFGDTVRRLMPSLSPAVARVAGYLDQNRATVLASSAQQIATHLHTSDATVIRGRGWLFDSVPADSLTTPGRYESVPTMAQKWSRAPTFTR